MARKEKDGPNLPNGFEPLSRKSVDGWFVLEEGNVAQGFIRGSFQVPNKFNRKVPKTVYMIELTEGGTSALVEGEVKELSVGDTVGVDEKGWLSALDKVEEGREVYIRYKGLGKAKEGQSAPHMFDLGVVPI